MFVPLYDDKLDDPKFYPFVTRALVGLNVIIFVFFQLPLFNADPEATIFGYGVTPAALTLDVPGSDLGIPPRSPTSLTCSCTAAGCT